jgi:hypothetical protein
MQHMVATRRHWRHTRPAEGEGRGAVADAGGTKVCKPGSKGVCVSYDTSVTAMTGVTSQAGTRPVFRPFYQSVTLPHTHTRTRLHSVGP